MAFIYGRIPELPFKVIILVFFGIAIFAAIARMSIRLRLHTRLQLDDYFLLLSCVFLSAATGVLYYGTPSIFFAAELTFNLASIFKIGVNEAGISHQLDLVSKMNSVYLTLSWITIFLVKFGFLSLFKHLVNRVPPMYRLWKGTLIFTILISGFAVCDGFITCPKYGLDAVKCGSTNTAMNKALAVGIIVILLDMLTDAFILAIPVCLLWRVRMKPSQKFGLAVFLCLSICMIVMAIIRVSGIRYRGKYDMTWAYMWQQIEACIAVTMLPLTAFRSIFVAAKPGVNNLKANPWVPSTRRIFKNHKETKIVGQQCLNDLTIPFATLTGLSEFPTETKATHSRDESITLNATSEAEHQRI